ncbi:MAG: lysophospholipid acyltransferase family protein [Patescibacteria group bacterium]
MLFTNIAKRFGIWLAYITTVLTGFTCTFFFKVLNRMHVYGKGNIPSQGHGVLLVSNHQTMFDSFAIGVAGFFPDIIAYPSHLPLNFAAKENYFIRWYFSILLRLLRTIPVNYRTDPWLMRKYLQYLQSNNLLIFYQGTRSYRLDLIKNGPGFAVAHSNQPLIVIPVYIEGVSKVFGGPKTQGFFGRWFPKSVLRHIVVAFGERIDFSDVVIVQDARQRATVINQRIVDAIKRLQAQYTLEHA